MSEEVIVILMIINAIALVFVCAYSIRADAKIRALEAKLATETLEKLQEQEAQREEK